MATIGAKDGGSERRDAVLRALRAHDLQQQTAAEASAQRRRFVVLEEQPDATSRADAVLLRKDLLNVVETPSEGAVEVEVTIDADGGLRFYVVMP